MRGTFYLLLLLGIGALLAGCCANNVCDCQDERADAFYFRFDTTGGPNSFAPATELDTVFIKRFTLPLDTTGRPNLANLSPKNPRIKSFRALADSLELVGSYDLVTIVRATAVRRDTFLINNNAPFAQSGTRKLGTYLYRVEARSAPLSAGRPLKLNPRKYDLLDVVLKGEFYGTGCCTCYRNNSKTATLTNNQTAAVQAINATETDQRPVYTPITK